jgi:hypothetical protein
MMYGSVLILLSFTHVNAARDVVVGTGTRHWLDDLVFAPHMG